MTTMKMLVSFAQVIHVPFDAQAEFPMGLKLLAFQRHCDSPMGLTAALAGWRSTKMANGEKSVITTGARKKPQLCVRNLVVERQRINKEPPALATAC